MLPSIVTRELLLFSNYGKLRKRKSKIIFMSCGLKNLGYITDQSRSQSTFSISKNNANYIKSFW